MTSTAVATSTPVGVPAYPGGFDPYAAYGEQATASKVYITFKNGEYLFGADQEEIPLGTRFIANMAGLRIGWKHWSNRQVTDERMGLLAEGFRPTYSYCYNGLCLFIIRTIFPYSSPTRSARSCSISS